MSRKRLKAEQFVNKLREADVLIAQGRTVAVACKQIAVTEQTYYRWRKEYGGLNADQAKRLCPFRQAHLRVRPPIRQTAVFTKQEIGDGAAALRPDGATVPRPAFVPAVVADRSERESSVAMDESQALTRPPTPPSIIGLLRNRQRVGMALSVRTEPELETANRVYACTYSWSS